MKHRLHLTLVLLLFVQGLALLHGCSNSESEVPGPGATGSTAAQVLNLTPDFITLEGVDKDTHYKAGSTLTLTLTPGENARLRLQRHPHGAYPHPRERCRLHPDIPRNGR